jgi:hypothetical protein
MWVMIIITMMMVMAMTVMVIMVMVTTMTSDFESKIMARENRRLELRAMLRKMENNVRGHEHDSFVDKVERITMAQGPLGGLSRKSLVIGTASGSGSGA